MAVLIELRDTNATCPLTLLWDRSTTDSQQPLLYVCLIATITHSIFWLQLVFCPAVRKKSMQWLYAYLITDILLLFRFFFQTWLLLMALKQEDIRIVHSISIRENNVIRETNTQKQRDIRENQRVARVRRGM